MRRVIILVIDSMGVGAMPDAEEFGDSMDCNTLANVAIANNGLYLPMLQKMGLGNITDVQGVSPVESPIASYGRMQEVSHGKDTTTGHWEMAGLVLDKPFRVFPKGFPDELMQAFVAASGCGGFIGNFPASGTEIIERYDEEHVKTGFPIIYTSADSVFQIACNLDIVPLDRLYRWCEIARNLLDDEYNTSRVIARPYQATPEGLKRVSASRKDYSVPPMKPTILDRVKAQGGNVIAIGKIEDIFVGSGVTHAVHTGSNKEGLELTVQTISRALDLNTISIGDKSNDVTDLELVFINLVDTDMLFGHRNDAIGYGQALEEIDQYLTKIIPLFGDDDLLMITADHGCDPTQPGTDHTREAVPILCYSKTEKPSTLGTKSSFTYVAYKTAQWLGIEGEAGWQA